MWQKGVNQPIRERVIWPGQEFLFPVLILYKGQIFREKGLFHNACWKPCPNLDLVIIGISLVEPVFENIIGLV